VTAIAGPAEPVTALSEEPSDPEPVAGADQTPRRCGACGAEVAVNARFCRHCGAPMPAE
jgi:hypothetical protein